MKSPPLTRALPLIALVIASLAAFAPGCGGDDPTPPGNGKGGSGGTGGTGGTGGDPGCVDDEQCPSQQECVDAACVPISCDKDGDCPETGHCPEQPVEGETSRTCQPNCIIDADCGFDNGLRCDDVEESETHGRCIPGEQCSDDYNCGTTPGFDYCPSGAGACVCVEDASVEEGFEGVCRRKTPTCSPCMTDRDCGSNGFVHDEPAECVSYNFDNEKVNVCLPLRSGARCPAGTIPDPSGDPELETYCVPQYGDCAAMNPCNSDAECQDNPAAPICDLVSHICKAACRFDFETNTSQGCPPSEVCHATTAFLAPNLLNECGTVGFFGQGKCGGACVDDSDCARYDDRTDTFICAQEGDGTSAERRCRPKSALEPGTPACLNDRDCPEGTGGKYLGYCDVKADPTQNECVYDNCRMGQDPRAGCGTEDSFADCTADFKCKGGTSLEVGECVEKDCIDKGGAALACRIGQFCAGEPMRNLLTGERDGPPRDPGSVPSGTCYDMEVAPWCEGGCGTSADCATAPSGMPSHADSPAVCDTNAGICNWGCEYGEECPGGWSCDSQGMELWCGARLGGLQRCTTDENCGGTNKCVSPTIKGRTRTSPSDWGSMAPFKVCECSDSGACGGGFECNAGIGTAGTDPDNAETFQTRKARYCAPADICGANGSCEWLGDQGVFEQDGPSEPIFVCAGTPEGSNFPGTGNPVEVSCPAADANGNSFRLGKTAGDQFKCVHSSVCKPKLLPDPGDPEAPPSICGVAPQP